VRCASSGRGNPRPFSCPGSPSGSRRLVLGGLLGALIVCVLKRALPGRPPPANRHHAEPLGADFERGAMSARVAGEAFREKPSPPPLGFRFGLCDCEWHGVCILEPSMLPRASKELRLVSSLLWGQT